MMMTKRAILFVFLAALASVPLPAAAPQQVLTADDWCRGEQWGNDREGVCEVRQFVVRPGATIAVDAAPNGGIQVDGAPRADIQVRAKVVAQAESQQRARQIADSINVSATADRVFAQGPSGLGRREGWSVSYRLEVPLVTSMSLRTSNGGISISGVDGRIEFKTVNGGVKLASLAGEVKGETSNGGVDVDLDGPTWRGEGLDVQTNNGGVRLQIPEHYSARLETGTVNGGLNVDFPVTVQGRVDREITADLGGGGPLIRVKTHNGGVKVTTKK
jgi:hypothetical protein